MQNVNIYSNKISNKKIVNAILSIFFIKSVLFCIIFNYLKLYYLLFFIISKYY